MIFLNATTDLVFKRLFGSSEHKNIVISFLNSILNKQGDDRIADVVFNAEINSMPAVAAREGWVDIKCTDQKGHIYIVEMQVIKQQGYEARCQYYSSLALSRQLKINEKYHELVPVIFVGIVCFNLFKSPHYTSHHLLLDRVTHEHALKHLEFHFIELSKFHKTVEEVTDILDKWIYLLKNSENMRTVPSTFKKETDVQNAFDLLEQGSWSQAELEAYERHLDAIRLYKGEFYAGLEEGKLEGRLEGKLEGKLEGLEEGRIEGRLEGIEEGKQEGRLEEKKAIARDLVDVLDIETIAKKTGLSIEDIKKLSEE